MPSLLDEQLHSKLAQFIEKLKKYGRENYVQKISFFLARNIYCTWMK
jgi:hypothetical protein